jgi:hypothetical protein
MSLIREGLELLQAKALRVYRINIDRRRPPVAGTESVPACIAILLLTTGLDYHLARLKYLRDIAPHDPILPHTPYFSWDIGDSLSVKLERLLVRRHQKTLREQLLEISAVRDSVAHPKFYEITQEYVGDEWEFGRSTATLPPGYKHRTKTLNRKMAKTEHTRLLRLPLVPTWISYRDAVLSLMVVCRMLLWMEREYCNPYGWVGNFLVRNQPPGDTTTRSISIDEWTKAFFCGLSASDQDVVRKRLRGNLDKYLNRPLAREYNSDGESIGAMLNALRKPRPPDFLSKPPPKQWNHRP